MPSEGSENSFDPARAFDGARGREATQTFFEGEARERSEAIGGTSRTEWRAFAFPFFGAE